MRCVVAGPREREFLKALLDYDLCSGCGRAIDEVPKVRLCFSPSTGRLRYVDDGAEPIMTVRASDMHVIPRRPLAEVLHRLLPYPRLRVVVVDEVAMDVACSHTLFARHVLYLDPELRSGDEALLVDESDNLLGIATLRLGFHETMFFTRGPAGILRERVVNCEDQE